MAKAEQSDENPAKRAAPVCGHSTCPLASVLVKELKKCESF
jgi:hypothetical protein